MQQALGRGGVPSVTIWVVRPPNMISLDNDTKLVSELTALVRSDSWIMDLLRAVRAIHLPKWCIELSI